MTQITTQAADAEPTTALTSSSTPQTVFITGALTTLGRAVIRRLRADGHIVIGTATTQKQSAVLRAEGALPAYPTLTHPGDLRSAMTSGAAGVDTVINLMPTAVNQIPFVGVDWEHQLAALTDGAAALVEAAKRANVKRIIHASYWFANATATDNGLRALFSAAVRAEQTMLASDVPAVVLRFGYIYGSVGLENAIEDDDLMGVITALKAGRALVTSTDRHARAAWIHTEDAAHAVSRAVIAADEQVNGKTLTIADDVPMSPADVLRYLAENQGLRTPGSTPAFAGRRMLGSTQYSLINAAGGSSSSADAKTALSWQPRFTSVKQGIDDLLLTMRSKLAPQVAP